jgi:UDP-glucose/galactose:(glucosyl)LPS alpha-1,2-glucosyl/galactosyltransferase
VGGRIVVAFALDRAYLPWTAVAIRSCALEHPSDELHFEVVHDSSLSAEEEERLEEAAGGGSPAIRFHRVPPGDLAGLPSTAQFGTIVWLRLLLPDLLSDRSRVIYLDSDVLVMSGLEGLWATPLGSMPIAAVANVVEASLRAHVASLGVEYPGGFFNSGVLLMDLERMRAEGTTRTLLDAALDRTSHLVWPDQDVLNRVFARRWLALHPRWNAQNSFWAWPRLATEVFGSEMLHEARRHPAVRHFEGPGMAKPWHYLCPYPAQKQYRKVLAGTPWAGTPLVDRTLATRLIKYLPGDLRWRAYARLCRARQALGPGLMR